MKGMGFVGAALVALISAGCATDPTTVGLMLQAQADAAKRPTLSVDCPAGCSVQYTDPRDRQLNARLPTNGYDAAIAISGQVTGLIGGAVVPAAMGAVAVEGFKAMRGHGATSTTTTNTTTNTTTSTDRHDVVTNNDSHDTSETASTVTTTDRHDSTATTSANTSTDNHSINNSYNPTEAP